MYTMTSGSNEIVCIVLIIGLTMTNYKDGWKPKFSLRIPPVTKV